MPMAQVPISSRTTWSDFVATSRFCSMQTRFLSWPRLNSGVAASYPKYAPELAFRFRIVLVEPACIDVEVCAAIEADQQSCHNSVSAFARRDRDRAGEKETPGMTGIF